MKCDCLKCAFCLPFPSCVSEVLTVRVSDHVWGYVWSRAHGVYSQSVHCSWRSFQKPFVTRMAWSWLWSLFANLSFPRPRPRPRFCAAHPFPAPLLHDSLYPGAATATQQGTVIAWLCDFTVPSAHLVPVSAPCLTNADSAGHLWKKKKGCFKRDSGTSEHAAFQAGAQDLALPSAKCEFKLDLEFRKGFLGVNKMTGYFCAVLTQYYLSVHSNRPFI